jgi:hypothetical protein
VTNFFLLATHSNKCHQQMIETFDDTPVKGKKKPRRKSKSKSAVSDESDAYTASLCDPTKTRIPICPVVADPLPNWSDNQA